VEVHVNCLVRYPVPEAVVFEGGMPDADRAAA